MKQAENESWCAWHERWEMTFHCIGCDTLLPACYVKAHLMYACTGHTVNA